VTILRSIQQGPLSRMVLETLVPLLTNNPYFSAGAGLLGLGTGLALVRQGIVSYGYFLKRQFLTSLEVTSKDKSYYWILKWISLRCHMRGQHLSLQTLHKQYDNGSSSTLFGFLPSPGIHYVTWQGRWLKIERQRERTSIDLASGTPFESVILTTLGRNASSYFVKLLEETKGLAMTSQLGKTVLYTSWANEWRVFGHPRRKRPLESVILEAGIKESILADIQDFNANGKWYFDRGIPYRRGYLLYGPPGTGKSSFIQALAGELDYNICLINLSEAHMTDERLQHLLSVIPEQSLLLLEDMDALFTNERMATSGNYSRITFSGLLNALDGVGSSEERIVFMTTNHYAKLDPALLRPGRIDVVHYIGPATLEQIQRLFSQFYPNSNKLAVSFAQPLAMYDRKISPAKIQGHFIRYKNDPQSAVDQVSALMA
jgi:mitochondrial chaperone BCS1